MQTKVIIQGMACNHCAKAVRAALEGLKGVSAVEVDLDAGIAYVESRGEVTGIKEAIEEIGFDVTDMEIVG